LADPKFSIVVIVVVGVFAAIIWMMAIGGSLKRRLTQGAIALAATAGVLLFLQAPIYGGQNWWSTPNVGLPLLIVTSLVIAFTVTMLSTGLGNRRALGTALTVVVVGAAIYYPMQSVFKVLTP